VLTVVTGVSEWKSTLIKKILFPAMQKKLDNAGEKAGQFSEMTGLFHI
jgi:excinuclease ABC subunit A